MSIASLISFVHDDITWCAETCPFVKCYRNSENMMDKTGFHSYAWFKGTSECPIGRSLDECIEGCVHANECFAKHDDPDEALRELQDEYCDKCIFSSLEED